LKKKLFGDGGWAVGRRGRFDFLEHSASSAIPIFGLSYIGKWEQHFFFFLKGFSTHGELKKSLEHEVYVHLVIHKCLVAGRWYGPNIHRNFPLVT